MVTLVPEAQLLEEPVVTAHLAVIAGDDDESRAVQPALLQVPEEGRQPVVDLALGAVVGGADLPAVPLAAGRTHASDRHGHRPERVDGRLLLAGRAPDERSDRLGRVQVVVAEGVAPRRVGTDEGSVDEEGRVAVALQPAHDLLAHEGRLRELHGEARRSPGRPVLLGTGEPLDGLVQLVRVGGNVDTVGRQPATPCGAPLLPGVLDEDPEAREDPLVAGQPRVAGRHGARIDGGVGVAEENGVVPALAGKQGHVGEPRVQRSAVQDGAVAVLVRARVEAGARRPARRGVGPVIGEEHAARGQRIERRRLQHRMPQGREAVTAPLVQRDEQHVAWRRHAPTLVHCAVPNPDTGPGPSGRRLTTCGPSLLRAGSRTRSARPRRAGPASGALLGLRPPGVPKPSAVLPRGHRPGSTIAGRPGATPIPS